LKQLNTDFFWKGRACQYPTILFLQDPRILAAVWRGHAALLTGLGFGLTTVALFRKGFNRKSKRLEKKKILEGNILVSDKELRRRLLKRNQASSLKITPELPLVKNSEVEHLMVCGATRMGKTSTVIHLLSQVRDQGQKAVVLDLTGELTALFFRESYDKLLNPLDVRSEQWRIWDEGLSNQGIEGWAQAAIPVQGNDPYWSQAAQNLLVDTTRLLAEKVGADSLKMQDILSWGCQKNLSDKDLQGFYATSDSATFMQPAAEKTAVGVRGHLNTKIKAFRYLNQTATKGFSIREWVAEEKSDSWLFLTALPDQRAALAPLLASWCSLAFSSLERLGPSLNRRLWFIVDEFPGLNQPLAALPRMVAEGAKYGACCFLSFQNKPQLDHLYGSNIAKNLLGNCNTKMIFRSPEPETASALSQLLGQQEVSLSSESLSMGAHHLRDGVGISNQQREKTIVSASTLMTLDKFEAFVQLSGNWPVCRTKIQPFLLEPLAEAFVPKIGD
jgi:type IV conjugative transfer system coupling protein TraD